MHVLYSDHRKPNFAAEETKARTLDALKEAKLDLEQVAKSVKTAEFEMSKVEGIRRYYDLTKLPQLSSTILI